MVTRNNDRLTLSLAVASVTLLLIVPDPAGAAIEPAELASSFVEHMETLDQIDADRIKEAKLIIKEAESASDAIPEALAVLYPEYEQAAIDAEESDDAKKLLKPFVDTDDRYLAADASFYLARSLMNQQRYEDALPLLKRLTADLEKYSAHRDVTLYFVGIAQAGLLEHKQAVDSLMTFLQDAPDAPERLRVSAWRKVQDLQAIEEGKLDDVYQRMDFSRRRLELEKTDQPTQQQQDRIVKMLAQLIKEEEKKEVSSSSKNTKQPNQQHKPQQASNQQKPSQNPGSKSQSPGNSRNANGKVVDKTYDDAPASPWSRLRDRSRDPANNAVKEKLPARYRDIVEKYYEAANQTD